MKAFAGKLSFLISEKIQKNMKDLRIVIPAHNEESSIAVVLQRIKGTCPEAEIVVVDDASTDRTAEIVKGLNINIVSNPEKCGKGGATKVGFTHNLHEGIKYLAFIDADNTYPPERFPELYRLCKEQHIDLVVGSRFLGKNEGMPWIRKIGNKIFAVMLSFYSGRKTTDTSTGMRILNTSLLEGVNPLANGLDFDTAMTTWVLFSDLTYAEVPIDYFERSGRSKLNSIKDGYRFLKVIMNATRKYRPLLFYCTLGLPFMVLEYVVKISTPNKLHND